MANPSLAERMFADIKAGIEEGLITMPSGQVFDEKYVWEADGQLMKNNNILQVQVNGTNARTLVESARIMCHAHQKGMLQGNKWLELGPGCGLAASEAALHSMEVDTVGLSPLAPRYQPHLNLLQEMMNGDVLNN